MSLSKRQMVAAASAGLFVVCAGTLGWFLYDSYDVRQEIETELSEQMDAYTHYNEAAVFPSKKSIADVKSNAVSYAAWRDAALDLASRGDKILPSETAPIFKQRLQSEVRRLRSLPGGAEGHISSAGFMFGFEQYLSEGGTLPGEADVPRLAIQLDTIARVVDLFADAGVLEVLTVQRLMPVKVSDSEAEEKKVKSAKGKKVKDAVNEEASPSVTSLDYRISFTTRPAALVKVLNKLTSESRFVIIDDLSFSETADMIVDKLTAVAAAEEGKDAAQAGRRAGRRRRPVPELEKKAVDPRADRLVVDPESDAPIQVGMKLTVFDFGRGVAPAVSTPAPAEQKPDVKKSEAKKEVK